MQTIYLDISNKGIVPTIYAKQGEVGRKFTAVLTDAGVPYVLDESDLLSAWYEGTSGTGNYTTVGENSAFTVDGNKVTIELITQMLTNDGDGVLSVSINKTDGSEIATWNIPYLVERKPGVDSPEAESFYTAFSEIAGQVADSANRAEAAAENLENITPEAIGARPDNWMPTAEEVGAAPGGFGLGKAQSQPTYDLNQCLACGWYCTNEQTLNLPHYYFRYSSVQVSARISYQIVQRLVSVGHPQKCEMLRYTEDAGATWVEEWVNPPMITGVEYRTTERYNGATVYAKCISYTPSGTVGGTNSGKVDVSFPHNISDFGELVSASAKIASQPLPAISSTGGLATLHSVTDSSISIRLYNTELTGTFIVFMRYTKS